METGIHFARKRFKNDAMKNSDEGRRAESILERIDDDQRSMIVQDARGARIDKNDPVEVWAKRVGRILGYGLLVVLVVNLFTGWFF